MLQRSTIFVEKIDVYVGASALYCSMVQGFLDAQRYKYKIVDYLFSLIYLHCAPHIWFTCKKICSWCAFLH